MRRITFAACFVGAIAFGSVASATISDTEEAVMAEPTSAHVTEIDSYLLSDINTGDVSTEPLDLGGDDVEVIHIAEPGTLGLVALAGLMGGAVAMRRRLG